MKIVIDKNIPYMDGLFERVANVLYVGVADITRDIVKDADCLIVRTRTKCNEKLLSGSKVRFIATATIGYDHIDTEYCRGAGIAWSNAPGCNAGAVEQYVGAALAAWATKNGIRLKDMCIGIVGVGHVGSRVERLCRDLGMNVLRCDPPRAEREGESGFVSLEEIVMKADIVSFHTPLTFDGRYATYRLAGSEFFRSLERNPLVINAARGGIVDEAALKDALLSGRVSDCVIDCWDNEPDIDRDLLRMALLATPHIAGYSAEGKVNATRMCVEAVSEFFGLGVDLSSFNPLPEVETMRVRQELLLSFIAKSYDIPHDSETLKRSPETFEAQRSGYRFRREHTYILE